MNSNKTVLIAEDDYASRELLKNKVTEHKRNYIVAEDGQAAINVFKENPDISLVFMDIRLPEVDGVEAMKQIKEIRNNVIVIAQTAYFFSVDKDKHIYLSNGFDGFIEKPFDMDMISEILERYN